MRKILFVLLINLLMLKQAEAAEQMIHADRVHAVKFFFLLAPDAERRSEALKEIEATWRMEYAAPIVEILTLTRDLELYRELVAVLERNTGQRFGTDLQAWFAWIWSEDAGSVDGYPEFKAWLYGQIDPKFDAYFSSEFQTDIRLDEVRWGGVRQDGIPPLRQPTMIKASEADYLKDDHVVFALEVNGDARAYPKRILAWHEMFVDEIGGVKFAGVYCTLCGSMILYETEVDGTNHEMGTSGFLYRSNKLMYDSATQSLWSTLLGKPVIGPLVGQGIEFKWRSVVTTTWGEWRRRHPKTQVLSLETGYERDYGEGVAYRDYFSTDELMFNVPKTDNRLQNKAEILGLRLPNASEQVLAISAEFLAEEPIYVTHLGQVPMLILTDKSGANRVYELDKTEFVDWDQDATISDSMNMQWQVTEDALVGPQGQSLARLPAYRAFWFGWYSQHPNTKLIH